MLIYLKIVSMAGPEVSIVLQGIAHVSVVSVRLMLNLFNLRQEIKFYIAS